MAEHDHRTEMLIRVAESADWPTLAQGVHQNLDHEWQRICMNEMSAREFARKLDKWDGEISE